MAGYERTKRTFEESMLSAEELSEERLVVVKAQKKHPVMILNEKFPAIDFLFVQDGPAHEPFFKVHATIDGKTFEGSGKSKQKAKLDLATQILVVLGSGSVSVKEEPLAIQQIQPSSATQPIEPAQTLFGQPSPTLFGQPSQTLFGPPPKILIGDPEQTLLYQPPQTSFSQGLTPAFSTDTGITEQSIDFTSDMPGRDRDRPLYAPPRFRAPPEHTWISHEPNHINTNFKGFTHQKNTHIVGPLLPPDVVAHGFSQYFTNRPQINVEKARSYPVMVLCEIFPDMQINWCEGIGRGDRQFKVEAEVQGRRFFGEGRSKKMAKLNLAKTILLCMYDIHDFKDAEASTKTPKAKTEETQLEKKFPLTQLKELVGEDLAIDVVQKEGEEMEEKLFHATVVVKGVAYEAVGKNRNLAKLRAAKKALDVIRPKKDSVVAANGTVMLVKKEIDIGRHPTMVFYELYRDVKFVESETKTASGLTEYNLEAEVEGQVFKSKASSKKKAKLRVVLHVFEQLKEIKMDAWSAIDVKDVLEDKQLSNNPAANHPIVLLLKLNPQARFDVIEDFTSDTTTTKYKATACVGEREFSGEGPNKKTAKTAAARQALQALYGIDADNYVEENRTDFFADEEPRHEVPAELCNMVANAVQEKFLEVFQGESQCKVIAAFVMAKYEGVDPNPALEVVSVGTGTKCITGDQIDHKGQTLNDSHGEIIACRGFRQFLFDELLKSCKNDPGGIFDQTASKKYALKSNIKVYLYVNTAPCGDGRVFTLQTQQTGAKNKTAGLLRTKIENGQGTIPVPENSIQTSDGLLEGERLRTMSCSDKILRWNALGVQGALLSYFLDPIYLEGIVISLHYHYDALYRALYKRAGKMMDCPEPYKLNKPGLGTPTKDETSRDTSKATSNSFNWYFGQKNVEAVNATTGKTVVLASSRLCKLNFFDKFMQLLTLHRMDVSPTTYHDAKILATDYAKVKEAFFAALSDTTCGKWIGKPYEHDMFGY